jgi:Uma2 family endonuclease
MSAPRVSEDLFYAIADEDSPYEYLDGTMVIREPSSYLQENLFSFLLTILRQFIEMRGLGVALGSRYAMRLDEKWSPEPDILVVREERRHLMTRLRLEGVADLVIEIQSPTTARYDLRMKLPRSRQAGVPEIWLVDPRNNVVRVDTARSTAPADQANLATTELPEPVPPAPAYDSQTLAAGRLRSTAVPGFWIDVEWLWQQPLPPTLDCLRQILG